MQVLDRASGQYFDFPDHATDQDIINTFEGARQQTQGGSFAPLAQQFMQGMQQPIAQQIAQGPQRSTLPNIGGGAMVGLNPQQAQFVLGQAQQSNVDSMAERMKQQQMVQQGLESEKDRQQQLKFQQAALKNQIAERKMMQEQAKFEAEQRANESSLDRSSSEKMATQGNQIDQQRLEQQGQQFQSEMGLRQQGLGMEQKRIDLQQQGLELDAKQMEQQGWQLDTIVRNNPDSGQQELWRAYVKPGFHPEYVAQAPSTSKSQDVVDRPDHPKIYEQAASLTKDLMRAATDEGVKRPLPEIQNEALVTTRLQYGQAPFTNQREIDTWIEMDKKDQYNNIVKEKTIQNGGKYEPTPEDQAQAELDAKTNVLDMMDKEYQVVNGEIIFPDNSAQQQAPAQQASPQVNMNAVPTNWK